MMITGYERVRPARMCVPATLLYPLPVFLALGLVLALLPMQAGSGGGGLGDASNEPAGGLLDGSQTLEMPQAANETNTPATATDGADPAAPEAEVVEPRAAAQGDLGPGTHVLSIRASGHTWTAHLHVPRGYDGQSERPLVVGLHGAGGDGLGFLRRNGWAAHSEREGFLVVAPDGLPARPRRPARFLDNPRLWNTGQLDPRNPRSRLDDAAFFRALLAEVVRRVRVDERRIYLTGHSNGAGMTFRLTQEFSERLAAIAPVASHCWQERPRLERPLPTLCIYGLLDPLVPYDGGESWLPWGGKRETPPVEDTLKKWAAALGCDPARRVVSNEDGVETLTYDGCRAETPFRVIRIAGHGHEWPGARPTPGLRRQMGESRAGVDATALIWDFFRAQQRE